MYYFLMIILFLAGTFLRLYNVGQRSIWFDEADVILSSVSVGDIWHLLQYHNPKIIYRVFIFYWHSINPFMSEWLLRLPSILFSLISIVVLARLVSTLFKNREIVFYAVVLVIFSPISIYYAQEISCYSLLILLSLLSFYSLYTMRMRKRFAMFGYITTGLLGIYTHPIFLLVLMSEAIYVIFDVLRDKSLLVKTGWSLGIMLLLYSPVLFSVCAGKNYIFQNGTFYFHRTTGWIPMPTSRSLLVTLKNFTFGYNAYGIVYLIGILTASILFFCGIITIIRKWKRYDILIICVLPALIVYVVAKISGFSYYVDRYLLVSFPFYYIVLACGIGALNKRMLRIGSFIFIIFISILAINSYYNNTISDNWTEHVGVSKSKEIRAAAQYIYENRMPGDTILHTCRNTALPFEYYFDYKFDKNPYVLKWYAFRTNNKQQIAKYNDKTDMLDLFKYMVIDETFHSEFVPLGAFSNSKERIWVVFSSWKYALDKEPERFVLDYLKREYTCSNVNEFEGVLVYLFTSKNL